MDRGPAHEFAGLIDPGLAIQLAPQSRRVPLRVCTRGVPRRQVAREGELADAGDQIHADA